MSNAIPVGHFSRVFLRGTETFIQCQLPPLERYAPVVLTRRTANEQWFSWEPLFASRPALKPVPRLLSDVAYRVRLMTPWEVRYFTAVGRRTKVRLIHAHHGQDGRYVIPVVRRLGVPLVTQFHGWDASRLPRAGFGLGGKYLQALFREATMVFVLSSDMRSDLERAGCPPDKLRIHRVGIDVDAIPFERRSAPIDAPLKVVSVGRFIPKKGFGTIVRAFAQASRQHPPMHLTLIGDGPLRRELESLAGDLGIAGKVTFAGFLANRDVHALLRRSHLMVQASATTRSGEKEGIPVVLMEAMATGMLVVATLHAGIPELIEHGVSGLLVPEHDTAALAGAIVEAATSPHRWASWTGAARATVETDFNTVIQARRLERLYDEVLA